MEIKYIKDYIPGTMKYLSVHNSGGLGIDARASTQHLKVANIDRAHADRWMEFKDSWPAYVSSMGFHVGYNFVIEADGAVTQTRAIGEECAHTKGHNFDAIGILIMGNFTKGVDMPTLAQITALKRLYEALPQVSAFNILPHRLLQSGTGCYGSALPDDWARTTLVNNNVEIARLTLMVQLLTKLVDLLRQARARGLAGMLFGSVLSGCGQTDVRG